jgi:hypothetical protein
LAAVVAVGGGWVGAALPQAARVTEMATRTTINQYMCFLNMGLLLSTSVQKTNKELPRDILSAGIH